MLHKYGVEGRPMKCCEPRDLINRMSDICTFEGRPLQLTRALMDAAWGNYFGTAHNFESFNEAPHPQSQAAGNQPATAPDTVAAKAPAPAPVTWVYLTGGARLRVDEIRRSRMAPGTAAGKSRIFWQVSASPVSNANSLEPGAAAVMPGAMAGPREMSVLII